MSVQRAQEGDVEIRQLQVIAEHLDLLTINRKALKVSALACCAEHSDCFCCRTKAGAHSVALIDPAVQICACKLHRGVELLAAFKSKAQRSACDISCACPLLQPSTVLVPKSTAHTHAKAHSARREGSTVCCLDLPAWSVPLPGMSTGCSCNWT